MSHNTTTRTIYIDTTTTPHTGVSVADVNAIIQEGSLDVGTLCKSDNVNPMAKYKPVEYNTIGMTGKTSGSYYWQGNDGQCGLSIPAAWNVDQLAALGDITWGRVKPSTWFRLLDFDGYNGSNAVIFNDRNTMPTGYLIEEDNPSILVDNSTDLLTFHVRLNAQTNPDFLSLSDMRVKVPGQNSVITMADMYLGIYLYDNMTAKGEMIYSQTVGQLVAGGTTTVPISLDTSNWYSRYFGKQYNVLPYLMGYGDGTQVCCGIGRPITSILVQKATDSISGYVTVNAQGVPQVTYSNGTISFGYHLANGFATDKTIYLRWQVSYSNNWNNLFEVNNTREVTDSKSVTALLSGDYTKTLNSSNVGINLSNYQYVAVIGYYGGSASTTSSYLRVEDVGAAGQYTWYWNYGQPFTPPGQ